MYGCRAVEFLLLEPGEVKPRSNALGVESVDGVSRVTLGRDGRIRLNSNRFVAAIEKAKQCVGLHSQVRLFPRFSRFFNLALKLGVYILPSLKTYL